MYIFNKFSSPSDDDMFYFPVYKSSFVGFFFFLWKINSSSWISHILVQLFEEVALQVKHPAQDHLIIAHNFYPF